MRNPDKYITLRPVSCGPWKGRVGWRVDVPPRRISNGRFAVRQGICADADTAKRVARRMVRWHLER